MLESSLDKAERFFRTDLIDNRESNVRTILSDLLGRDPFDGFMLISYNYYHIFCHFLDLELIEAEWFD